MGVGCSYESRAGSFGTLVMTPHPALVLEDPIPEMSAQVLPLGVAPCFDESGGWGKAGWVCLINNHTEGSGTGRAVAVHQVFHPLLAPELS